MIDDFYLSGVPRRVVDDDKKEVRKVALFAELKFMPGCGTTSEGLALAPIARDVPSLPFMQTVREPCQIGN
jgi:hypothetical protein